MVAKRPTFLNLLMNIRLSKSKYETAVWIKQKMNSSFLFDSPVLSRQDKNYLHFINGFIEDELSFLTSFDLSKERFLIYKQALNKVVSKKSLKKSVIISQSHFLNADFGLCPSIQGSAWVHQKRIWALHQYTWKWPKWDGKSHNRTK